MKTSRSSSDLTGLPASACAAAEQALVSAATDWHSGGSDTCQIDYRRAAGVAAEAILDLLTTDADANTVRARHTSRHRELRRLRRRLDRLEHLAELVSRASVWDYTPYDQAPGDEWLAIDRDHYQKIVDALASVDTWRPWERPLERRLGDV